MAIATPKRWPKVRCYDKPDIRVARKSILSRGYVSFVFFCFAQKDLGRSQNRLAIRRIYKHRNKKLQEFYRLKQTPPLILRITL